MSGVARRIRLADVAAGARLAKRLAEQERWPRERLARHQQERLDALVAHATAHAPLWRERLGAVRGPVRLADLPVLDKATALERFDDAVTDRRLRRDALLAHVEGLTGDALYLGRYRAMTTSGSSGRKGLFVYDRPAWAAIVAQFLRYSEMAGVRPRLPRLRVAALGGSSPAHMTRRVAETIDVGLHRVLSLPVTLPLPRLVDELGRFQPQFLAGYPSVVALLAEEQLAGRLRIAPAGISTSSELCTPAMAAVIEEAFGVRPVDLYGTTEGLWGCSCAEHAGIHLFEDLTIVENVDADGRPVPDGEPGARLLITSLVNLTQPLIRLELADAVTLTSEPCACGRTLRRMTAVAGRSDDVLRLPARDGGEVVVHPMHFGLVAKDRDVLEFQVVQEHGAALRLDVVARADAGARAVEPRLADALTARLRELGVAEPRVAVRRRPELPRAAGGKLQIVVAERGGRTPGAPPLVG